MTGPLGDRASQRALLERFVRARPSALAIDPDAGLLLDVGAGKVMTLDWTRVASVTEQRDGDTGRPYLLVSLGDGGAFALADQGIAFAPSTASTSATMRGRWRVQISWCSSEMAAKPWGVM